MPQAREFDAKKAERLRRERVFYTPDLLGPLCVDGCGTRVPVALVEAGIHGHPTCGPLFRVLWAKSTRASPVNTC